MEISSLTALRGIAAVGVVLFHIDVCLIYREMGALLPKATSGLIANGYLWVDLFFILSGYVIHHAYAERLSGRGRWVSVADFYRARFLRIYPLHLTLTALLVVAVIIGGALWPAVKDGSWATYFAWSALPSSLLLTHAMNQHSYLSWNIVSWSIGAEWWCYAAAPIAIPLMARFRRWAAGICLAMGVAVLAGLFLVLGRDTLDITYDFGIVRCLGGFLLGLGLYQVGRVNPPLPARAADALAMAAVTGVILVMHFDASDLLAIPFFAMLVMALGASQGRVHGLLAASVPRYLGKISYSIYLVHGLIFLMFWYAAPALGWRFETLAQAWLFAAAFLVLTIAGAAVSYRWIELPAQRLARTSRFAPAPKMSERADGPSNSMSATKNALVSSFWSGCRLRQRRLSKPKNTII